MKKKVTSRILFLLGMIFLLLLPILTLNDQKLNYVETKDPLADFSLTTKSWLINGTAICNASGEQSAPQICSDGTGGHFLVWADLRGSNKDIYMQRIDSKGVAQWTPNGIAICTEEFNQHSPQIIGDGDGGAIVVWVDGRADIAGDNIYAQRVNGTGHPQWADNGTAVCTIDYSEMAPQLISDGNNGAIITWVAFNIGTNYDIYAQRVNSSGDPQWDNNGTIICNMDNIQLGAYIASDGMNGSIITWIDYRNGSEYDIYAQRINSTGATQWGGNGTAICTYTGDQSDVALISDAVEGAILVWVDDRNGNNDIYAQRVNGTGHAQWGVNGKPICTASFSQLYPKIIDDGTEGAIIAWHDSRNMADTNIWAQRINFSGGLQWPVDGIAICIASGEQFVPQLASDGMGGAIIAWEDRRTGIFSSYSDIYAQWVNSAGTIQWGSSGIAICNLIYEQSNIQTIGTVPGAAVIIWQDNRTGANFDIYAQLTEVISPNNFSIISPIDWISNQTPDVICQFFENISGVDVSTIEYMYSTNNGSSWSGWSPAAGVFLNANCTLPATDSATGWLYAQASSVPFNKDSASQNLIQFRVRDLSGNLGTSSSTSIKIDILAPGNFSIVTPSDWSTNQTPDLICQFYENISGVNISTMEYAYSTDNGSAWSSWLPASVYNDSGCTLSAIENATGWLYAKALAVPFGQDSNYQNQIQFRVNDSAGNLGTQSPATIKTDATAPETFLLMTPLGWSTNQTPTIISWFNESTSGVNLSAAEYRYSINNESSWSAWSPAGLYTDLACMLPAAENATGGLYACASAVPFNQDSDYLNKIQFRINDSAGNSGIQSSVTIKVDSTPPGTFSIVTPSGWSTNQTPDVICQFYEVTSGVNILSVEYAYSTNNGSSWSSWLPASVYNDSGCTLSAIENATGWLYAKASVVPFSQNSDYLNLIQFRVNDSAGNMGIQSPAIIKIDASAPSNFSLTNPLGWISNQTPDVVCYFEEYISGLNLSAVEYAYSTNNGTGWSAWLLAEVYIDAACQNPASDNATGSFYAKASAVPFNQDSDYLNKIQFRARNSAGNLGTIDPTTIKIDATAPETYTIIMPLGWITNQTPNVICQFYEATSGVNLSSVQYSYSKTGGSSWSAWLPAGVFNDSACTLAAIDNATGWLYAKATAVPFNQESGTQNQIRFRAKDALSNLGTQSPATIKIDATAPLQFSITKPDGWTTDTTPDVICQFNEALSGVNASAVEYSFSTNNGSSWSSWIPISVYYDENGSSPADDNATGWLFAHALGVPFNQDSSTQNLIRFRVQDMVSRLGTSSSFIIKIDSAAPGFFSIITPSGWINNLLPTVICEFSEDLNGSGVNLATVEYAYSTTGSSTPTNWALVDGVYTDLLCTSPAPNGSTGLLYARVLTVPFNQESATLNTFRFRVADISSNLFTQPSVFIRIDTSIEAPSGLVATPSDYTSTNSFTLSWTNPSDASGIVGVYYKLDSPPTSDTDGTYVAGLNITSLVDIQVSEPGAHNIYIWMVDSAGNVNASTYITSTLYLSSSGLDLWWIILLIVAIVGTTTLVVVYKYKIRPSRAKPKKVEISTPEAKKQKRKMVEMTLAKAKPAKSKDAEVIAEQAPAVEEKESSIRAILDASEIKDKRISVFISYATEDTEVFHIQEISKKLKEFPDIKEVLYWEKDAYKSIIDFMDANVEKCDVFLLFCSKKTLKSAAVKTEWQAALSINKIIIPIFDDLNNVPFLLKHRRGVEIQPDDVDGTVRSIFNVILHVLKESAE